MFTLKFFRVCVYFPCPLSAFGKKLLMDKMLAVLTSDMAWEHFSLVARLIEKEAACFGYTVFFHNVSGKPCQLQKLVRVLQADRYLISRKAVIAGNSGKSLDIPRPAAYIEDVFLKVVDGDRVGIPKAVAERIAAQVKYLCSIG